MLLPCRCRISKYDPFDRVGRLACSDGQEVRFGASACTDFEPTVGLECWLVQVNFDEVSKVYRAIVVNLTGENELDRLSQIEAEVRAREERHRMAARQRAEAIEGSRADPAGQLRRISTECGLVLPPLYSSLALSGQLYTDSPSYQWLTMVSWLELVDIPDPDLREYAILDGLVPFAKTPYGDWWCWWLDRPTQEAEYEVLLCLHDSLEAEVWAPTFAAWIARVCLTWGTTLEDAEDEAAKRQDLRAWASLLRKSGSSLADHLERVASQAVGPSPEGPTFLSAVEQQQIIADICGPAYLDKTLAWRSH